MLYIIFILLVGGAPLSLSSEIHWKKKQLSYWNHHEQLERDQIDRSRFKEAYRLRKEAHKRRKERIKRGFIDRKFNADNKEKAEYLLKTYTEDLSRKNNSIKRNFLKKRKRENLWKKKYPISKEPFL